MWQNVARGLEEAMAPMSEQRPIDASGTIGGGSKKVLYTLEPLAGSALANRPRQ